MMKKEYWGGRIIVREATIEDGYGVAEKMRKADQKELWSAFRLSPFEGVVDSIYKSTLAYSVELDGKVVAVLGIVPLNLVARSGVIWLLGTDELDRLGITFGRYTRPYLKEFIKEWDYLENWVHEGNSKSLNWLKMGGFTIEPPEPFGIDKENFCRIWLKGE